MADNSTEIKRIIDIEFKGAKTIGDIKNNITQLKKELDQCANGSKEAAAKSLELARAQSTLTAAMKGCVDETGKLDNSYNGLVTRMNRLKIAQKQLNLETDEGKKKFKEYATEINNINNKLKDADAMNGVFTRNVGNYTSALGSLGGQFGTIAGNINKVTTSMNALKGAGGWITGVAAIIAGITAVIKTNEDAVERLQVAISPFKGLFDSLYKGAQDFGDAFSKGLSTAINNARALTEALLSALGAQDALNRMRQREEIEIEKQNIENQELKYLENRIERQQQLDEWRASMVKWRKNEEFVAKAVLEIEKLEKEDARELYLIKKAQYDLQVKINAQTKSGKKDIAKELELYNDLSEIATKLRTSSEDFGKAIRIASGEEALKIINDELEQAQTVLDDLVEEYNKLSHADIVGIMQNAKQDAFNAADSIYEVDRAFNQMITSEDNAAIGLQNAFNYFGRVWDANNHAADRAYNDWTKRNEELVHLIVQQKGYVDNLRADQTEAQKKADKEAAEEAQKAADKLEQKRQELINKVNSKSSVLEQYVLAYFTEFNAKRVEDLTKPQLEQILNSWNEVIAKDADYFSKIMLERLVPENGISKIRERVERYRTELEKTITDVDVKQKRDEIIKFIQDLESGIETITLQLEDIDKLDLTNEEADVEKAPLIVQLRKYTSLLEEERKKLQNLSKDSIIADMVKNVGKEFEIKVPVVVDEPEEEDIDKDLQKRITAIRNRIDTTLHQYNHETKSLKEEYEQQQKDLQIALNTKLITQEEYNRSMKNLDKDYLDAKRSIIYEEIGLYAEMASSIGSILGSIADMWEDDLRTKVEHGEMTQEQAEKEFEDVKAFQIAEAVINTITGAISGYAGAAGNSGINSIPYVGPFLAQAVGITNAAAVTASGIAQIAKIKNTQFGSSSVSGGGYGSTGNQSFQLPALETFKPNYSQNLTSVSDTTDLAQSVATAIGQVPITAVVVESQLRSVQNRVNKRNEEITF